MSSPSTTTTPSTAPTGFHHRNPRIWSLLRFVSGLTGAALVVFPVASGNSYVFSLVGLTLFITAILFLPTRARPSFEDKARELGAHVVVDGGRYHLPNSSSFVSAQLFLAADRISVLDSRFDVLLEIPAAEITSFLALQAGKAWYLEVIWSTRAAEFSFRGSSAERLAHLAENAIRKIAPAPTPLVSHSRAAGAGV